jgi:hypothetical protein
MRVVNFEASGAGAVLDLALAGFGGVQQFPATFVLRLQVSRREDLQPTSLPSIHLRAARDGISSRLRRLYFTSC